MRLGKRRPPQTRLVEFRFHAGRAVQLWMGIVGAVVLFCSRTESISSWRNGCLPVAVWRMGGGRWCFVLSASCR